MNGKTAKDYLPLVQALADGKTIQIMRNGKWSSYEHEYNGEVFFDLPADWYRIKPEQTIRPFNADELRQLFYDNVKLRNKESGSDYAITEITRYTDLILLGSIMYDANELLSNFEIPPQLARPDGGICGVEE